MVKFALIFTEQMSNAAFEDFFECFSKDGNLYLVFLHREAVSLSDKLSEESCLLKERLTVGRNLLERIVLLNMPDMLVYDVLDSDRIQVTPALDVFFLYSFQEIGILETITIGDVCKRMADTFAMLFEREISLEIDKEIPEFLEKLRACAYADYYEVYQVYLKLEEHLIQSGGTLKPNTFLFRLWEKVKWIFGKARPVLMTLAVLILAGWLIYSIMNPEASNDEKYVFQRIGTLNIQEGEQ
ncbi:MAG: hypothetical protein LUE96_02935 [Lachnospiraceae bacterium]|nr:hypothetical protein [Lachnospiraceae bacterium]